LWKQRRRRPPTEPDFGVCWCIARGLYSETAQLLIGADIGYLHGQLP
jgi:hypothetical protein